MGIREAVSVTVKQRVGHLTPYCVTLYSALKGPTSGECRRDQNKGGSEQRATAHTICVRCRPGSILHDNDRRAPVTLCRFNSQPSAPARRPLSGLSVRWRAASGCRRWGNRAAESSHERSPPAECPANLVLRRESAAVFVPRRSPGAGRLMAEDGRQMAGGPCGRPPGRLMGGAPDVPGWSRLFATAGMQWSGAEAAKR